MSEAARELAERYGGIWEQHPEHCKRFWMYEVENGDTVSSYWDWVLGEIERAGI